MTSILHRLLSAGVLMIWGSVLCTLYFSGRLASYLIPAFHPYTIAGGCALVVLALLVLVSPASEREEDGNGHTTGRSTIKNIIAALILLAPLFIALSTTQDKFGAALVQNRNYVSDIMQLPSALPPVDALPGEDTASVGGEVPPPISTNANGDIQANVIDLLYAAQLSEMRPTFEDKRIEVIGQLMPAKENNPKGDLYDVVRMFMTCCAADVQPIALPIQPATKPGLSDMTWVKVTGKVTFPVVGGQRRPLMKDATVEKTNPPEETFLY